MTALNTFSDVLRHAVEEGAKTEYTELMLQAAELLDAKVYTLPAAPVEGLDRFSLADWSEEPTHHSYIEPDPVGDYALFSQAEAIIAAKDKRIEAFIANERELEDYQEMQLGKIEKLEADNAALTARVKELEGGIAVADGDRAASRTSLELTRHRAEALETQLAAARKALKTIADAPACGFPEKWETTPAEVRQIARAALEVRP